MDHPSNSQRPLGHHRLSQKHSDAPWKIPYLSLYNTISALLWLLVLLRTLLNALVDGSASVYPSTGSFVKWVQTLAGLEILHSLLGVVRAPLLTTIMQVASRFLLVWVVIDQFPILAVNEKAAGSMAYCSMLVAWSVTEVIRYAFFALNLVAEVPLAVKWLRYNTFFVLYPLGIGSECFLIYLAATGPAKYISLGGVKVAWGLWAVLGVYVPGERLWGALNDDDRWNANVEIGSYILFTHMMAQRRKVMRGTSDKQKKTK